MSKKNSSCLEIDWRLIPEPVLIKIFLLLNQRDVLHCGQTCKRWNRISYDNYLWRNIFRKIYGIEKAYGIKPGSDNWYEECKRLVFEIPLVNTDIIKAHSDQVLHVSFSRKGGLFCTTSKDAMIFVWRCTCPCQKVYSYNMKTMNWKYTQFSQFNESDTLLLVSGVHFGTMNSTSGEIAVFGLQDTLSLRCRIVNKPYDIFGSFLSNEYVLSGEMSYLGHLVSSTQLWINKANQEISSEHAPVMSQLCRLYNCNGNSVRRIMVATCPWLRSTDQKTDTEELGASENSPESMNFFDDFNFYMMDDDSSRIIYQKEFQNQFAEKMSENDPRDDDLDNGCPKYLLYLTGAKTSVPHQIGIKRIDNISFPKRLDPGPTLKERIALRERKKELEAIIKALTPEELAINNLDIDNNEPNWEDFASVADRFDQVDETIEMHGQVIGMALSLDHRFLYVNSRPWPENYVIDNPIEPPPIAQEISMHIIDLKTLKIVGKMQRAHKAYTSSSECFFIFLDVCENYVASGAEDKHAYVWDRYYGLCLAKYNHSSVVNSVAFDHESNTLVTVSDDFTIKVWRTPEKVKELNLPNADEFPRAQKLFPLQ